VGRPREFDEKVVLDAAADAFWTRGYEGTSTRDLTARTGLTPSSLYAAFGDKQTLFRRALDHYLGHTLRARIARLDAEPSPGLAITLFFDEIVERSVGDPLRRGCMLVNSTLDASPGDAELQVALADELAMIEGFFHRHILAGQQAGEIPAACSADDSAKHLLSVLLGVRVLARVRPERALLTGAVRQALRPLGLLYPLTGNASSAPAVLRQQDTAS
jgi:TetR/AcrR family transcriptional repressor of nem operon